MRITKDIRPILIFSYVLIGSGIIGIFMFFNLLYDSNFDKIFCIFIGILTGWHLLTGIGIVLLKKWGFFLMKFYLYVLYLGFPIGTLIARKLFGYIKNRNIKAYFK
jgi:hypothetical protein